MTKSESVELLPCPWCGSRNAQPYMGEKNRVSVACQDCGAQGPYTEPSADLIADRDRAITLWNTRTQEKK